MSADAVSSASAFGAEIHTNVSVPDAVVEQVAERVAGLVLERLGGGLPEGWLDVAEAAEYLRAPRTRVYDLVSQGAVRVARDGRRLLFRRAWLDAALDGGSE